MPNRLVVLDQNKLREPRAPEVVELLKNSPNTHFVLPDVAFVEMTKNPSAREATLVGSLMMLAPYPERIHISKGIGECLRGELERQVDCVRHMLLREGRAFVRNLLRGVEDGGARTIEMDRVVSDPDGHHAGIARQYLNHDLNKESVAQLIESMKKGFPTGYEKELRAGRIPQDQRLNTIHAYASSMLCAILQESYGFSEGQTWAFAKRKPMLLRHFYSRMWLCMDWIQKGGFECIAEEKVTNDLIDHEYIMTATCFHGLITGEKRVLEAYLDMIALLAKPVRRPQSRPRGPGATP